MNRFKSFFSSKKSLTGNSRQMIFFILRVLIIYIVWKIIIWFLGQESTPLDERHWPWLSAGWEKFNDWVRIFLLYATKLFFDIFGYKTFIILDYYVSVIGLARLGIGNYCLGFQLMIFFAALISSYPGKWQYKILYSVLGIIAINILNIFRFIGLIYAMHAYPQYMKFNHDFVFNVIVYVFTFLMWVIIIKKDLLKSKLV